MEEEIGMNLSGEIKNKDWLLQRTYVNRRHSRQLRIYDSVLHMKKKVQKNDHLKLEENLNF